jgi:radical SAM protein with 4Fe4S-binding SPASM domain
MTKNIVPINEVYHMLVNEKYKALEKKTGTDEYWNYRRKWVEYPQGNIVDIPLNIDIELTNACNLKCPMCTRTMLAAASRMTVGLMKKALFFKIVDEAATLSVPAIKLNWRGESTLHPDIVEFVGYAKKKGIIDVILNTNAVKLTKELSKGLIDAGLDKIIFSFDSPDKTQYEAIRIGANFEKVLDNIKNFVDIRERQGGGKPLTSINVVHMNTNEDNLAEFKNLFGDIVDGISYLDFLDFNSTLPDSFLQQECFERFICPQPWQRLLVTWDGKVLPCCADHDECYILGNANKESLLSIWTGRKINVLRNAFLDHNWTSMDQCKKCQKSRTIAQIGENGTV